MNRITVSVAVSVLCGVVLGAAEFNSNWSVKGKRVININTVVRVNQIEVSRDCNRGKDEAHLHTVEAVETFRKAVSDAIPEAKVTWAFSWRALQDPRPNYVAVRKRVVEFHRQYGDEITFIPGAYFAPMYNSRAQTNRDIHDGLKLVGEMVGGGYRPHGVVAGFLAADNLRYLAEEENIHVAQGTIWSQYGIDNGDGDGSICYPYYPSREHACKAAQGKADFIDCVNLDGWTCDFLCARKFGFEGGGNSRTGVGPIETYGRLGLKDGMKETRAVVRSHFGDNFRRNGFGWIVVNWEICLVKLNKPEYTAALTQWLNGVREEFPDTIVPLMSEFGEAWRRENPDNDRLDYRFVQRGNCIHRIFSEPNLEIRWYMNRKFRLATLRDWTKDEPEMVIDFTRYDLPAKEPPDASVNKPTRNWSLVNRINQKGRRPQDAPIPLSALTPEERRLVDECYQPPAADAAGAVPPEKMRAIYEEVKTPYKAGMALVPDEGEMLDNPMVFRKGDTWCMMFIRFDGRGYETHLAESKDLRAWKRLGCIFSRGAAGQWDSAQADGWPALVDTRWEGPNTLNTFDGRYWMMYLGGSAHGYETDPLSTGVAWTDDPSAIRQWTRYEGNPVLSPSDPDVRAFEKKTIYKHFTVEDPSRSCGGRFVNFYNGKAAGKWQEAIGMAVSDDMLHWRRVGDGPVVVNGNRGISGDPFIKRIGDVWVMFYFGCGWGDVKGAFDTFACSRDLRHWTKWTGEPLIKPSESYDSLYAHKPWVLKHNGVVYHWYCAVSKRPDGRTVRGIALATSKPFPSAASAAPRPPKSAGGDAPRGNML